MAVPCSLKSQYQPCGYVPAQASDDGEAPGSRRQPLPACAGAMNSVQKEGAVALFAMTLGREIMIHEFVCPHVRWVGRPWVVISKTLGTPASGLETASPPAWFPWVPGGGLQIRHIIHIQIVARGEARRRSFGCAASICLGRYHAQSALQAALRSCAK